MIIVAALVALVQVSATRTGTSSPVSVAVGSVALAFDEALSAAVGGARSGGQALANIPSLERTNQALQAQNVRLQRENAHMYELVAAYREQVGIAPRLQEYAHAVEARVIGFPPENGIQSVTIDKGSRDGIAPDDGVLAGAGVVGRVVEVGPFVSKVALITDLTSTIPAIVQRGRYWGVAKGNQSSVRLDYVSQDAPLRVGDRIVTGEARSFHSGALIGTIVKIERGDSSLYQTALLKPAVDFSTLDRIVVIPK